VQRTVPDSSVVALRSGDGGQPAECLAMRRGRPYEHPPGVDLLQPCATCGGEPGAVTCQPSVVSGKVIGSLLVTRAQRMKPADREAIAGAVNQAAPVLANLRNLASAQHRAATDALTGLPNHRSMLEALDRLQAGAARTGEPLAAVVLDLDHFKRFNDRHGHQAGDQLLAEVGRALRAVARDADFVGRWGGEEFLLLLPRTDAAGAVELAEKVREAIAALAIPGIDTGATGSLGVAAYPLHASSGEALVRAADEAMYAAKRGGRDRVTLAEAAEGTLVAGKSSGLVPEPAAPAEERAPVAIVARRPPAGIARRRGSSA
jgi:diguanylate cyclase (GGDEF)-like protein